MPPLSEVDLAVHGQFTGQLVALLVAARLLVRLIRKAPHKRGVEPVPGRSGTAYEDRPA